MHIYYVAAIFKDGDQFLSIIQYLENDMTETHIIGLYI
jgi:hypothetical protein